MKRVLAVLLIVVAVAAVAAADVGFPKPPCAPPCIGIE